MNRGQVARAPNAAELARVEAARLALRSTARWARFVGIYLPCLLGLMTLGLTFANYPGSELEKLLVSLASLGLIGAMFCLPLFLSSTGRTISTTRRFELDAANGFPIVEEVGEVRWAKRGFVAATHRGRLISPLFTKFGSVPAYWHHFDGLAAGTYLFSLLPASRLVIDARPAQGHPIPSEHESAAEDALRAAFRNTPEAAALNREGRATGAQRWRLLATQWWAVPGVALFGATFCITLFDALEQPALGTIFGAVASVAALAFFAVRLAHVVLDILAGKLESATGTVRLRYGETDVDCSIGPNEFTTSLARSNVFQTGRTYRVHWFKYSRVAVGADPM